MSVGKIIICTIFLAFVLFENVQTVTAIAMEEYTGLWYHIGSANSRLTRYGHPECHVFNISYSDGQMFNAVHNFRFNDTSYGAPGFGWIKPDGIMEIITSVPGPLFVHVQSFNNGNELFQTPVEPMKEYRLLSRSQNASDEAKAELIDAAKKTNANVEWINQQNCPPFSNQYSNVLKHTN